jgi:hypothetical protein
MKKRTIDRAKTLLKNARSFFNSYTFYIFQTLLACVIVALKMEVLGVVCFIGLLCVLLIVCDDILPTTLPFLLVCAFSTNCYDSFNTFIGYAIYAPVVVSAFLCHYLIYFKGFKSGKSVEGICAVSIAVLLGGIGNFSLLEYIKGGYYILGLGVGMLGAYFLMKSEFSVYRSYDIKHRFAVIMSLLGFFCVALITIGYARKTLGLSWEIQGERPFSPNNIATLLMFCMPFPVFLSKKKEAWALGTILIYGGICLTYSRGGLLFGGVEFIVCVIFWILLGRNRKKKIICVAIVGAVAFVPLCIAVISVVKDRFTAENLVGSTRWVMIFEAVERFWKNPLFGSGILDNTISYGGYKKAGAMAWYHMMIPQIIGSMGLVGVIAYLWQGVQRGQMVFCKKDAWGFALGVSYLGILLMSQVNPGEFCPLPFELLTVLLFILQEERVDESLPLAKARSEVVWRSIRF